MAKHNPIEHLDKKNNPKLLSRKQVDSYTTIVTKIDTENKTLSLAVVDTQENTIGKVVVSVDSWDTLDKKTLQTMLKKKSKNTTGKKTKTTKKHTTKVSEKREYPMQSKKDTTILNEKKPLFIQQSIIEVSGKKYRVIKYEYLEKKYTLEDVRTKDVFTVTEKDILERGWRYVEKHVPMTKQEVAEQYRSKAKLFLERADNAFEQKKYEDLVEIMIDVHDELLRAQNNSAPRDAVSILENLLVGIKGRKEAIEKDQEQVRTKEIILLELEVLNDMLALDNSKIEELEKQIAKFTAQKETTEGKKIFDEIVAKENNILETGVEANEYYFDTKDGVGNRIRHYYLFDGRPNGSKKIQEDQKINPESEMLPEQASRIRAIVRLHIDNPKEVTTTKTEDVLKQYPAYIEKILSAEKLVDGFPDEVKFVMRRLFDEGNTIESIDDAGDEYTISYTDESRDAVVEFIAKQK